jgi:hypothetical protein
LDPDLASSSFAHDELFLRFTTPRPRLGPEAPVDVYCWLARAAPGSVIELPWDRVFMFDRILALYQKLHGRQVVVAAFDPNARLAFRNMTSPEELLASRGRWLIVHPAIVREEAQIGGGPWAPTGELRRRFRGRALAAAKSFRALWGPPDYADNWAIAWDLDRLRSAARQGEPLGQFAR